MIPDELEVIKRKLARGYDVDAINALVAETERAWAEIEEIKEGHAGFVEDLIIEIEKAFAEIERLELPKPLVKKAVAEIEKLEESINLTAEFMAEHTVFGKDEKKRPASYFRKDMRDTRYTLKLKDKLKEIYFD